jgi:ATP-dependent RNA helicase DeaD
MASFDKYGFNKELLESISGLGFKNPTPIQTKVIPEILSSDNDIIATAQTGTGKTAAFGLPLIHLTNNRKKTIESVILCPTRELCLQISKDLNIYSEHMKYNRIVPIYGGSKVETQIKGLKQNPKIIVCT